MIDYAEKRNFQRMTLDCNLEYWLKGSDDKHCGTVKNLSATGVLFIANQPIAVGSELKIVLTPENSVTPPMHADVVVSRCDQQGDDSYLLAGEISKII